MVGEEGQAQIPQAYVDGLLGDGGAGTVKDAFSRSESALVFWGF